MIFRRLSSRFEEDLLDIILSKFFQIPETGAPIQHIQEVALLQPILILQKPFSMKKQVSPPLLLFSHSDGGTLVLLELNSDDAMEAILNEKCSLPSIAFLSCLCVCV